MRSFFSATENNLLLKLVNLHSFLGAQTKITRSELLDIIMTFRRAREIYYRSNLTQNTCTREAYCFVRLFKPNSFCFT